MYVMPTLDHTMTAKDNTCPSATSGINAGKKQTTENNLETVFNLQQLLLLDFP